MSKIDAPTIDVLLLAGLRRAGRIMLLTLCLPLMSAIAQDSKGNGTHAPGTAPGAPAGSYTLSGFESVNLFNGNLNIHLPLLQVGGRGSAQMTVMLSFDSRNWEVE
ncbi:MAG: hypothetical protein WCB68_22770, partial [Pyrinomonadaceae bacterium]